MKRHLKFENNPILSKNEFVLEVSENLISLFSLEVTLLVLGFSEKLTLQFPGNQKLVLSIDKDLSPGDKAIVYDVGATTKVKLVINHAEYLQAVLLRTFRDQIAEVNHIHIEGIAAEEAYDITVLFENYREPMTAEEAAKLLDD